VLLAWEPANQLHPVTDDRPDSMTDTSTTGGTPLTPSVSAQPGDGLWVLAATTGMRRSELAGVKRSLLDLSAGTLILEDTRVVVDGRPAGGF
jgi:hypothetical protein